MNDEHPLLGAIRAAVGETGVHLQHWGQLRREAFPATSWTGLQAWCAQNTIACELAFSQSSKKAEVQFRRLKKAQGQSLPAPSTVNGLDTPA